MKFGKIMMVMMFMAAVCAVAGTDDSSKASSMMNMKPTHEFGYASPGSAWLSLSNVNKFLNNQGLSGFLGQAWTVSLGGYRDWHRVVMEHSLNLRIWGYNLNGALRTSMYLWDATWNTGFNTLPPEWPVSLYPYVGLGVGLNTMFFGSDTKTFATMLATNEPDAYAWEFTPLFNVGLGSNYLFPSPDSTKGFSVGLRLGFLVDLFYTKRWISDGVYISDLPSISQTGPYIRLTLGGWDKHGHHHMHHDM